jgi:hypothetical protein
MIRKVAFYWFVLTLVFVDSWLLSKPNILGKIGLAIFKYHYLRSFPRTLLTVWIVVSISVLIVYAVHYLLKQQKLSRTFATVILGACLVASLLIMGKVYIDFSSWSYSHTGIKFIYGAHILPMILILVFINGLAQVFWAKKVVNNSHASSGGAPLEATQMTGQISSDTSLP